MKMGNASLSIIPVPNFYMNRTLYEMETFNIKKKRYFKEKELFRQIKDINLSNNPRYNLNKFEDFNRTKYIPPHRSKTQKIESHRKTFIQETEAADNFNSNQNQAVTVPKEVFEFEKFEEYLKTHASALNHPEFKSTLRDNLNKIVDRIHSNYDIDKWNKSMHTTPEYLTNIPTRITLDNVNDNESHKFQITLKDKISSLSLENKDKEKMLNSFVKNTTSKSNFYTDNYKTFRSTGRNFLEKLNSTGTTFNMKDKMKSWQTLPSVVENREIKLPTLNFNNFNNTGNGFNYNGFGNAPSMGETRFNSTSNFGQTDGIRSNNQIISKLSDTRNEFSRPQAEKVSFRRVEAKAEQDIIDNELIDPRKYNAFKFRDIYCERVEKGDNMGCIFQNREKDEIPAFLK